MIRYHFIAFLIPFLFISTPNKAQKVWSLDDCIKYAWDNNLQIKRQELQTEISKNNFKQSRMNLLPNLTLGGNHSWVYGHQVNPITNSFDQTRQITDNGYAQSTLVLFSGLQEINSIAQNRYLMEKSLQDFQKAKNDISMQIATSYLQILFGEENLVVAKQQVDLSHQETEKMKKLFTIGDKAKGDILVMQAQEANDQYNYVTAKNNLKISYLTLRQLLELKSTDTFKIQVPDTIQIDKTAALATVDDIYKLATEKMPEIQSAEYDLKNNEKALAIAKGSLSPQLSISASYGTAYTNILNQYSFSQQLHDNESHSIYFTLNIPLFNRFQTRTNISNARLRVFDSQYNLEQVMKTLYKEIENARADAVAALEKYNSASEEVRSNEEAFNYSQQKYDVGILSAVDYNLAKTNLIKAKSDQLQAKYEYVFRVKVLDFYKGIPITLK